MRRRPTVVSLLALGLAVALSLSACTSGDGGPDSGDDGSGDDGSGDGGSGDGATWAAARNPVDRSGLVWTDGDTVHLGDGSTLDAGTRVGGFVVAGDGAYVVPAGSSADPALLPVTADDAPADTGAHADPTSLRVSPDGRYLGFIDATTGTEDQFGRPVDQAVVVDLQAGREVLRTARGMGDPEGDDDLTDLYEDAGDPAVTLTAGPAYVSTPDGTYSYDLSASDVEKSGTAVDEVPSEATAGSSATNPSGAWSFVNPAGEGAPRFVSAQGAQPVTTRAPYDLWSLSSWLDDTTAAGFSDVDDGVVLLTCTLPTGRCTTVEGTGRGVLLPADQRGATPP